MPMIQTVKKNPIASAIIGFAAIIASVVSIGKGLEEIDALICSEAEAQEMIAQEQKPVQREQLEYMIKQNQYQLFILEQKEQYGKSEPWEGTLQNKLRDEIKALETKKDELK